MIPIDVREAMERVKRGEHYLHDAAVVAKFAVPILERLLQEIDECERFIDSTSIVSDGPDVRVAEWIEFFSIRLHMLKTIMGDT